MRGFNKKAMVGGILALSLVLAGTGYAYWTDTLNVTNKVATGDLDVTSGPVCPVQRRRYGQLERL
ncbi:TasA family protein [Oscillibacter sp.]|uniref:TasA family protein n=1 Tax=Oscillibacter sp. TaxID=1945593 RepID=UPI0037CB6BC6